MILYRMRAARPAAAAIPAKAVWRAAPPVEEDVEVAPAAADDALEAAEEAAAEALEAAEEAIEEALEDAEDATEDALDSALEATLEALDVALPPAPPTPKMVVEPTTVEKVDEPEVSTDTMAEVVIADEEASEEEAEGEAEDPDPPAPIPKIVVEPTTVE